MSDSIEIRPSRIHGTGLFTTRQFLAGELVYTVPQGRIVCGIDIAGLTPLERNHLDRIANDRFEVIEPPGCHINHSCEPTVEEPSHRGIALRDLSAGEEITLDYDRIACLAAPIVCLCGARECRGFIRGRQSRQS